VYGRPEFDLFVSRAQSFPFVLIVKKLTSVMWRVTESTISGIAPITPVDGCAVACLVEITAGIGAE
jgi:hypothetical protein